MTLQEFLARITPHLIIYRKPEVAIDQCDFVSEAVRVAAKKFGVPLKIGSVTVNEIGHSVLFTNTEVIDFTLSQFDGHKKRKPFPFRCKFGSKLFNQVYGEFEENDNAWIWNKHDSPLLRTLLDACTVNTSRSKSRQ